MSKKTYFFLGFFYWLLWAGMFFIGKPKGESALIYLREEAWRVIYLTILNWFLLEKLRSYFNAKMKETIYLIVKWLIAILCFIAGGFIWSYLGEWLHISEAITGSNRSVVLTLLFMGLLSFAYFGLIRFYNETTKLKVKARDFQIQKQIAELNLLKSQTNPHFLFNTLNNLYGLAREQHQYTADAILKLSDILRFTLYKSSEKFIALEQEIKIIEDYIDLEKIRYSKDVQIHFKKQIANEQVQIPPLLLLPMVENAFKHGAAEMIDKPVVEIELLQQQNHFEFKVQNSLNKEKLSLPNKTIGLPNLKKQLELLYKEYKLDIAEEKNVFSIRLYINLDSYVGY